MKRQEAFRGTFVTGCSAAQIPDSGRFPGAAEQAAHCDRSFPSSDEEKGKDPRIRTRCLSRHPRPRPAYAIQPTSLSPTRGGGQEGWRAASSPPAGARGQRSLRGRRRGPGGDFPLQLGGTPSRTSPFPDPAGFQTFRVRRRRDWRGGGHLHANEAPPPAARRSIGTRGKEHAFRLGRRGESRPPHAPSAPRNTPPRRLPAGCRGTPLPRTPSPSKARASLLCFLMNPG